MTYLDPNNIPLPPDRSKRREYPPFNSRDAVLIIPCIAVCVVCGEPVQSDTLVAFCGHDDSRIRKCAA